MHIERLKISSFRNLRDFEIAFTRSINDPDGTEREFKSHAVIGQNGSGKSNLLEAIITIFRDLDLDATSTLDYEMDYETSDRDGVKHRIELKAQEGKRPTVTINGRKSSSREIVENPNTYLPAHIFAYYSGKNERVEQLFQQHLHRFNQRMRFDETEQLPSHLIERFTGTEEEAEAIRRHRTSREGRRRRLGEDQLRRLFYCRGGHTQLVLLACFLSGDPVISRILEDLQIVQLESALFVLKQPNYLRSDVPEANVRNGDPRFWFAAGTVVSEFLDKLWKVALAPIDDTNSKLIDFRGRRENQEQLYLFVPDNDSLKKLGNLVGPPESFFRYAEGAYIGDLIEEVRIGVKHKDVEGNVSYVQLSEGELQLLTVLGLMRITSRDNCLFLLDEPDTHLNPIWKLRYFDKIESVLAPTGRQEERSDSQIIITTHDPMVIGSLRKEQVRIFKSDEGRTSVEMPAENPQGMGVAGLLKSELFGLRSTVDSETRRHLDRRNYLYALGKKRTKEENGELSKLSEQLSELGFASDFKDPYFAMFVQKMALHTEFHKDVLTAKEMAAQDKVANSIIDKILKEKATS
jgi:predicted ATPase